MLLLGLLKLYKVKKFVTDKGVGVWNILID